MIVKPRIRGYVCITAHPKGCEAKVREEIEVAKAAKRSDGPKRVLVLGSSTGYGLSSRIAAAFGFDAATFGIFFERPSTNGKPASAGWYNSVAFEKAAHEAGLTPKASMVTHFPTKSKRRQSHRSKKTSVKLIWSCIVLLLRVAPIQRPAKFTSQCSSQSVTKLSLTARWIPTVMRSKTSPLSPRLKKRFNTPLM